MFLMNVVKKKRGGGNWIWEYLVDKSSPTTQEGVGEPICGLTGIHTFF